MKKTKRIFIFMLVVVLLCSSISAYAAVKSTKSTTTTTTKNGNITDTRKTYSNGQSTGTLTFKNGTTVSWGIGNTITYYDNGSTRGWSITSNGGGGGGGSSYSYTPPPPTIDISVADITPLNGRQGMNIISTVSVKNSGTGYASSVAVEFVADGKTQTKYVNVSAGATVKVSFVWAAPMSDTVPISATVNKSKTITETNYNNNSLSKTVSLKEGFKIAEPEKAPENAVDIPSTPTGEDNRTVTWTENGVSYTASLQFSASASEGGMKSGYGFKVSANTSVTTNYPDNTMIMQPQMIVMFVPEFGFSSVVSLVKTGSNTWELPVNSISPVGEKRWYVPVWWPDGKKYEAILTAYGAYTPGGELIGSEKVSIMIDSNMYTDDSTNGMWAR